MNGRNKGGEKPFQQPLYFSWSSPVSGKPVPIQKIANVCENRVKCTMLDVMYLVGNPFMSN